MVTDRRFYMTYARGRPKSIVPWVEQHSVPLLTNAVHRWTDRREKFLSMWEYGAPHTIDAGGYNVQSSFVKDYDAAGVQQELDSPSPFYPWSVKEYDQWLSSHSDELTWATAMDYACEERFDDLWSVQDRIDATIENTVKQYDRGPDYKLLPVLQGRCVDDYIESYERLSDQGIPTDHVGLGTVCRLSSEKDIVRVEHKLRERTDVEEVHGFGVKVTSYRLGSTFDSADSAAWVNETMYGRMYNIERNGNGLSMYAEELSDDDNVSATARRRKVHSFQVYYAYVTWMMEGEPAVNVDKLIERQKMGTDEYDEHIEQNVLANGGSWKDF